MANPRSHEEYGELTSGILRVIELLIQDRNSLNDLDLPRANHFWRRTFVRQLFADTEVSLYQLRTLLLIAQEVNIFQFTPAEVAILKEESYRVDERGHAHVAPLKIRTDENFQFIFGLVGDVINQSPLVDRGSRSWECFKKAIKIRDRLMHPRTANDMKVDDEAFDVVVEAAKWLDDLFRLAFRELPKRMSS